LFRETIQGHVNHFDINISKTTSARDFKFGTRLCMGNAEWAHQKKIPLKVSVAYVTWPLQFLAYDQTYLQNYLS